MHRHKQFTKTRPSDGIWLDGIESFEFFSQQFISYALTKYDRLASELKDDKDLVYPRSAPASGDQGDILKLQLKMEAEESLNRLKLFGDILLHMSVTSERQVRQHADFAEAETRCSPRLLWKIIKKTHMGLQHAGDFGVWITRARLLELRQGNMSIEDYCRVWKNLYTQLLEMDPNALSDEMAKQQFVTGLHGPTFSTEISRWLTDGKIPATLEETMRAAITWYHTTSNAAAAMAPIRDKRAGREETGFSMRERKPRPRPSTSRTDKKKLPVCPICKKTSNHAIEDCLELDKFCEEARKKKSESPPAAEAAAATATSKAERKPRSKKAWSASIYSSRQHRDKVYIDSGATLSIWNSERNLRSIEETTPFEISGVNGISKVTKRGIHPLFGPVIILKDCPTNLVSLRELSKSYKVEYSQEEAGFKASTDDIAIYFDEDEDGLYEFRGEPTERSYAVEDTDPTDSTTEGAIGPAGAIDDDKIVDADTEQVIDSDAIIIPAEKLHPGFTKERIARAKRVHEFCKACGHVGFDAIRRAIKSGTFTDLDITLLDVDTAETALGPCEGCTKGKMVASKRGYVREEPIAVPSEPATEILHADLLFLPGANGVLSTVLLSVGQLSRLIVVSKLDSKSSADIQKAWLSHCAAYQQHRWDVNKVVTDNEANLGATADMLARAGVQLIQEASGSHEVFCERRVRAILSDLPYNLPYRLYWYLLLYSVQAINNFPDSLNDPTDVRSARERVQGIKLNAKLLAKANFGDRVLYHIPNDTLCNLDSRAGEGIVVGKDPKRGSLKVFNLETRQLVTRRNVTRMPHSDEFLAKVNTLFISDQRGPAKQEDVLRRLQPSDSVAPHYREQYNLSDTDDDPADEDYTPTDRSESSDDDESYVDEDNIELNTDEIAENPAEAVPDQSSSEQPRYNLRQSRGPGHSNMAIFNEEERMVAYKLTIKAATEAHGDGAMEAACTEVKKTLEYDVLRPAHPAEYERERIIPSSMFLKLKLKADGSADKLKARFVAGGHRQSWSPESDCSSPTVAWETVLCTLSVAACNNLELLLGDVPSAYFHASLEESTRIFMRIEPEVAKIFIKLRPDWKQFVRPTGDLIVRLTKAMYGLKQSGLLFHKHLSAVLAEKGFNQSASDPCIFTKTTEHKLGAVVAVYVDDLLIMVKEESEKEKLVSHLDDNFGAMSWQRGPQLSFIGTNVIVDQSLLTAAATSTR